MLEGVGKLAPFGVFGEMFTCKHCCVALKSAAWYEIVSALFKTNENI